MKLIKLLIIALVLQACGHNRDLSLRKNECRSICKPYGVSYVSAKNECVCDLTTLN